MAFIGGSLTPKSGNPVFRIYDVDPDTYDVMDFRTYTSECIDPSAIFDASETDTLRPANVDGPEFQHDPLWIEYYSARESYAGNPTLSWPGSAPLNATFWHLVTESFERNE